MHFINQSAFLKALGWSLLDSLWQMGLMWLVYVCLTANGKKFEARQRHTIALLSLAGGSLWFLITLVFNCYTAASAPLVITVPAGMEYTADVNAGWFSKAAAFLDPALPFLSMAYLCIAGFLFVRFYRHYHHIGQLHSKGISKVPPEWRVFLQQAAAHMGIKKKVSIWFSSLVDTPLTLGFWKPVILLPVAAVNHLSLHQAEAIILHELNHIRRNDYLVNLLIACTDIILFFNPFSRLLTGIVRRERENSCDDLVLQFRYDAAAYATALLNLEQNRHHMPCALAVAATGRNHTFLLNRVKRILSQEQATTPLGQKWIAYLLSAMLIGFIGFYNPGKVIVKTIDVVKASVANTEYPQPIGIVPENLEADNDASIEQPTPAKDANEEKQALQEQAEEDAVATALASVKDLEQWIELATEVKLAAIAEEMEDLQELANFANTWQRIDFTMPDAEAAPAPPIPSAPVYPFIPNSSFMYQVLEDTTLPKKYIMTESEKKAKEAMDKALLALQEIDWKKLEKELNLQQKVNIADLQREIVNAIKEVDWKKVEEETRLAMEQENQAQLQEAFRVRLGIYQQQRVERQEKLKQAQQQILLDRLEQHEKLKKMELQKQKENSECPGKKKKKIIHI